NKAFSTIFNEEVYTIGAGRTDTGVHAAEMWAHFDVKNPLPKNAAHKCNRFCGPDIAIQKFVPMADDAHARFDATDRSYEYHILKAKNPFMQDLAWYCPYPLHVEKMNEAAKFLFDFEDFSSFS